MNRKSNSAIIWVLIILIAAIVAYYIYDVAYLKNPWTDKIFRLLAIVCALLASIIRLTRGVGRKSLDVYEKVYADELGNAFANNFLQRKKMLCVCRLYDESNYRKALKYAYQLLDEAEVKKDTVPVLLFIALCFADMGVNSEAIRVYRQLLEIAPDNAQVHSNLGLVYRNEGDMDSALKHFNRSIEINPKNYFAYVNRADYYFKLHGYDNAISDAKKALSLKNNCIEAASLLTIIYALEGDEENKQFYYHIAISSGEDSNDLCLAIEHFLSEKSIPSAEE